MSYSSFQRPHGFSRLHALGSYDVGDLEIQRDILSAGLLVFSYFKVTRPDQVLNDKFQTYRLDEVARSICSSRAEFDANHPLIMIAEDLLKA